MTLYHVRGRLYCRACILRCATRRDLDAAVVVDVKGLECHRCARVGYPALSQLTTAILRSTKPSGYRLSVYVNEYEGTAFARGPWQSDPGRWGYGITKADVTSALRELRKSGILLTFEEADAALHALHCGSAR